MSELAIEWLNYESIARHYKENADTSPLIDFVYFWLRYEDVVKLLPVEPENLQPSLEVGPGPVGCWYGRSLGRFFILTATKGTVNPFSILSLQTNPNEDFVPWSFELDWLLTLPKPFRQNVSSLRGSWGDGNYCIEANYENNSWAVFENESPKECELVLEKLLEFGSIFPLSIKELGKKV